MKKEVVVIIIIVLLFSLVGIVSAGSDLHDIGFTGQRHDDSTGLISFPYRTYDPQAGRFLQRDPSGYVDGENLYEYVSGNAMTSVDSLGLTGESLLSIARKLSKIDSVDMPVDELVVILGKNPEIAAMFSGRSRAEIIGILDNAEIAASTGTRGVVDMDIRIREASRDLKISTGIQITRRIGFGHRFYPPEVREEAILRIRKGTPQIEVSRELGVSRQTVRAWTEEEGIQYKHSGRPSEAVKAEALIRLRKGATRTEVGKELGVSRVTVNAWANKAGIKGKVGGRPKYSTELKAEALRRVREGTLQVEVVRDLGVSGRTLSKWLSNAGIRTLGHSETVKAEVLRRIREGATQGQIEREMDIPKATISRWARKAGIKMRRGSKGGPL